MGAEGWNDGMSSAGRDCKNTGMEGYVNKDRWGRARGMGKRACVSER